MKIIVIVVGFKFWREKLSVEGNRRQGRKDKECKACSLNLNIRPLKKFFQFSIFMIYKAFFKRKLNFWVDFFLFYFFLFKLVDNFFFFSL